MCFWTAAPYQERVAGHEVVQNVRILCGDTDACLPEKARARSVPGGRWKSRPPGALGRVGPRQPTTWCLYEANGPLYPGTCRQVRTPEILAPLRNRADGEYAKAANAFRSLVVEGRELVNPHVE